MAWNELMAKAKAGASGDSPDTGFDSGYKEERPTDRALIVVYLGKCHVLLHVGPHLDYLVDRGGLEDELNDWLIAVRAGWGYAACPDGVIVFEGGLVSTATSRTPADDVDEGLEGTGRLATAQEWEAHLHGEWPWDPLLWKETVAPDVVTTPFEGKGLPLLPVVERCSCDDFCDSPCPVHATDAEKLAWRGGLGDLDETDLAKRLICQRLQRWTSPADARMVCLALLLTAEEYETFVAKDELPADCLTRKRPEGYFGPTIAELQGDARPSLLRPFNMTSLVEQYESQAKIAHANMGWNAQYWKSLAELWASTDIVIVELYAQDHPGQTLMQMLGAIFYGINEEALEVPRSKEA
jgi:hypothetical protein